MCIARNCAINTIEGAIALHPLSAYYYFFSYSRHTAATSES